MVCLDILIPVILQIINTSLPMSTIPKPLKKEDWTQMWQRTTDQCQTCLTYPSCWKVGLQISWWTTLINTVFSTVFSQPTELGMAPRQQCFVFWMTFSAVLTEETWSLPCSGELQTQKLKSHLVRTQSLKVLHVKPGVDQYIAIHDILTARDFFLVYSTLPAHSLAFLPKPLLIFFPVSAVANTGSCVDPQNKIGHLAKCRFLCWVPGEDKQAQKNMTCGMMPCEINDLEIKWSLFSALM